MRQCTTSGPSYFNSINTAADDAKGLIIILLDTTDFTFMFQL